MPRRPADQPPLFAPGKVRKGRVEAAVDRAVRAAQREQTLGDLDAGLVAQARTLARSMDEAAASREGWLIARLAGELRETLARLRLDPTARGSDRAELADFFASLGRPAVGDGAQS